MSAKCADLVVEEVIYRAGPSEYDKGYIPPLLQEQRDVLAHQIIVALEAAGYLVDDGES